MTRPGRRSVLALLAFLASACAGGPGAWVSSRDAEPASWPPRARALAATLPRAGCPSGGAESDCRRGCRVEVRGDHMTRVIMHTQDGRHGAELTRYASGHFTARRWAEDGGGRADDFVAGRSVHEPPSLEAALGWMDGAPANAEQPRSFRRVYDRRRPARPETSDQTCRRTETTRTFGDCFVTTVRECHVVHARFGRCDGEAWRIERTEGPNGEVTIRDEDDSFATTVRDDSGRIIRVRGVFRGFPPREEALEVDVDYDAAGRLRRERATRRESFLDASRTLTRDYDDTGRLVRSVLDVTYDGADGSLEDVHDEVTYTYGACAYTITDLTPEPRHVALTQADVDWEAGAVLEVGY